MLSDEIETLTKEIEKEVKQDRDAIRLMTIPGIGPIVSSALLGWIGDGQQFKKGRDASAALGLVPRQNSSGGKNRLPFQPVLKRPLTMTLFRSRSTRPMVRLVKR